MSCYYDDDVALANGDDGIGDRADGCCDVDEGDAVGLVDGGPDVPPPCRAHIGCRGFFFSSSAFFFFLLILRFRNAALFRCFSTKDTYTMTPVNHSVNVNTPFYSHHHHHHHEVRSDQLSQHRC